MILETLAAFFGTVAFSLLFGVPKHYYPYCGFIGGAGWICYSLMIKYWSIPEATFVAAVLVVALSRFCAVSQKCPVTIFLISGIFPLVPGAGIYWTAYYIVMNQLDLASTNGFLALKVAAAIVLAIVFVFELPHKFFQLKQK